MKRLILMRHAKSSWENPEWDDYERPLNKRGKKAAPLMGERLFQRNLVPDHVLSSGAVRAYNTAKLCCKAMNFPKVKIQKEEELYMAGISTFLSVIHRLPTEYDAVMMLSHNPGISEIINYLVTGFSVYLATAGVVCIDFSVDNWSEIHMGSGEVVYYSYPKAEE